MVRQQDRTHGGPRCHGAHWTHPWTAFLWAQEEGGLQVFFKQLLLWIFCFCHSCASLILTNNKMKDPEQWAARSRAETFGAGWTAMVRWQGLRYRGLQAQADIVTAEKWGTSQQLSLLVFEKQPMFWTRIEVGNDRRNPWCRSAVAAACCCSPSLQERRGPWLLVAGGVERAGCSCANGDGLCLQSAIEVDRELGNLESCRVEKATAVSLRWHQ